MFPPLTTQLMEIGKGELKMLTYKYKCLLSAQVRLQKKLNIFTIKHIPTDMQSIYQGPVQFMLVSQEPAGPTSQGGHPKQFQSV